MIRWPEVVAAWGEEGAEVRLRAWVARVQQLEEAAMKAEDVPAEWVDAVFNSARTAPIAYGAEIWWRHALAAVAPLIAAAERERCAKVAKAFDKGRWIYNGNRATVPCTWGARIAKNIRAQGDA